MLLCPDDGGDDGEGRRKKYVGDPQRPVAEVEFGGEGGDNKAPEPAGQGRLGQRLHGMVARGTSIVQTPGPTGMRASKPRQQTRPTTWKM